VPAPPGHPVLIRLAGRAAQCGIGWPASDSIARQSSAGASPGGQDTSSSVASAAPATETVFQSNLQRCRIPVPPERADPGEWGGISVYDTREAAEATTRYYGFRIGRFVAEVRLPAASAVFPSGPAGRGFGFELRGPHGRVREVVLGAQTGGRGNYTLWGCVQLFREIAVDARAVAG
jgi:hypothetical protein